MRTFSWYFSCVLLVLLDRGSCADTYRAAVVEYYPVQNLSMSADKRTNANVDAYIQLIDELDDKTFDILVYPESTITTGGVTSRSNLLALATIVPAASEEAVPCDSDSYPEFFERLSCFARRLNTYLVVNLIEKEVCTAETVPASGECASDSWNMYNCDVVFDRNGTVIQRYRKYNLFGEYGMDVTKEVDVATFETDFGVTFGLFTCFDIMFEEPAMTLVRSGVKHIIFPTMWFSQLPFLSALQAQTMFAVANDVVFLAAGAHSAEAGSGGTGIYQGRFGPLDYDILGNDSSKVYVADVLKEWDTLTELDLSFTTDDNITDQYALELDDFYLKKENLSYYNYKQMVLDEFDGTLGNCRISWKQSHGNLSGEYYQYMFFYYSGIRSFTGVREAWVDVCGLVFCQNFTLTNDGYEICAERYSSYSDVEWPYTIEELTISSNFSVNNTVQCPNTLLSSIRPLDRDDYQWSSQYFANGTIVERNLTLLKPQKRLFSFAIYGRDYGKDNSAMGISANIVIVLASMIMAKLML